MTLDNQLNQDMMDVAEFVELVNEERRRTMHEANLTVATVARVRDRRGDRR